MSVQNCLCNYVKDPRNGMYNFQLGYEYEKIGHTASAAGFYIRTAEFSNNQLLGYEALLRLALCFTKQGSRVFTVKGILLRAVSILPDRPEAYFLLARTYQNNKDWQEAYTWACLGDNMLQNIVFTNLITDVEYPGRYGFVFKKAVAAWWIGLHSESLYLFKILRKNSNMLPKYANSVTNNLASLSDTFQEPYEYTDSMYERFKVKFKGLERIKNNHSQCFQDMFVLTMLNGKTKGTFLEIGAGDPFYGNNTALLEKEFDWTGIAIEINSNKANEYQSARKSKIINANALKINYSEIIKYSTIDYLQIDCDPPMTSLEVLFKIPFHKCKFAVITFEHDHYQDETETIRARSRAYLISLGYRLVIGNISPNKYNTFEDWWVHPELVSESIIKKMESVGNNIIPAYQYMLNE